MRSTIVTVGSSIPDKISKNLNEFRQELKDGKTDYRKLLRIE